MFTTGKQENAVPEIWGGIECTINRTGNNFTDQLQLGKFYSRLEYLDAIIALGIKTLRFPILWEKHQPVDNKDIDWTWATTYLNKLKENNISPIAGLLHHGSGPMYTDLLKNDFPEKFAAYAQKVAKQFPWITYYTPVNEPLTTARFSGLYGLWYPHKKNDVSFVKILLNQLKAVVLAMQEIRKINPAAMLVQTEDLGKTYSTPLLAYQADFENNRRWLTYDILIGRFNEQHPLWNYFMRLGIERTTMDFFIQNPCAPDIIGANHYITSERYLDEGPEQYPAATRGSNGLHIYADVEAVRVNISTPYGPGILLQELYDRYRLPIAITEAHLNCSREEQLRWLQQLYDTAVKLRDTVDIRAVTAWSLLGSFGWNKLLTESPGNYETGAFDTSAGYARPTALAALIKKLIQKDPAPAQFLPEHGWWKQDSRFFATGKNKSNPLSLGQLRPVIIIGKKGVLARAVSKACMQRTIFHLSLSKEEADISNSASLEKMIRQYHPWAIINTAGYLDVDKAETEKKQCYRVNTLGPQKLGILCKTYHIKLVCFSSDLVFDGTKKSAYIESDYCNPLNVYGKSKTFAENFLCNVNPSALIIRTSAFFTPWDNNTCFISRILSQLYAGRPAQAFKDLTVSPTYVPHLAAACLDLLVDDCSGIWHLANKGAISWYNLAKTAALRAGMDDSMVIPIYSGEAIAMRPASVVLASEKYALMPSLEEGLQEYFIHQQVIV